MKQKLNFKTINFFPKSLVIIGYILIVLGLIIAFLNFFFILIAFFGVVLTTTHYGIQFDLEKTLFKDYLYVLGAKFGKKQSSKDYPYLTVLRKNEKSAIYSLTNNSMVFKSIVFEITLLNENHYKKILLKRVFDKNTADKEAEEIAQKLNIKKVVYSPN